MDGVYYDDVIVQDVTPLVSIISGHLTMTPFLHLRIAAA